MKIIDFILLIWCSLTCYYFGLRWDFSLSVKASLIRFVIFLFIGMFWPCIGIICSIFILFRVLVKLLFIAMLFTDGTVIWFADVLVTLLSKEILFEWLWMRVLSMGDFALKLFKTNPWFDYFLWFEGTCNGRLLFWFM